MRRAAIAVLALALAAPCVATDDARIQTGPDGRS
jgi:hypothetical protein